MQSFARCVCVCTLANIKAYQYILLHQIHRIMISIMKKNVMTPLSWIKVTVHCSWSTGNSPAADFYPTVKAALRHESADSEEDCKGLGCHLGQGLAHGIQCSEENAVKYDRNDDTRLYCSTNSGSVAYGSASPALHTHLFCAVHAPLTLTVWNGKIAYLFAHAWADPFALWRRVQSVRLKTRPV